jgi:hypothetical protein
MGLSNCTPEGPFVVRLPRRRVWLKSMANQSTQPTAFRPWVEVLQTRHKHVRIAPPPQNFEGSTDSFYAVGKQSLLELSRTTLTTSSKDVLRDSPTAPPAPPYTNPPTQSTSDAGISPSMTNWDTHMCLAFSRICSQRFVTRPPWFILLMTEV